MSDPTLGNGERRGTLVKGGGRSLYCLFVWIAQIVKMSSAAVESQQQQQQQQQQPEDPPRRRYHSWSRLRKGKPPQQQQQQQQLLEKHQQHEIEAETHICFAKDGAWFQVYFT